jgi:hypothetical protein
MCKSVQTAQAQCSWSWWEACAAHTRADAARHSCQRAAQVRPGGLLTPRRVQSAVKARSTWHPPSRARFMSMRPLMRMSSPTLWLDTHPSKGLNLG